MHKSVLLKEAVDYLACENKRIILDCTIGGAGHAKEILKRLPPGGMLIGIDADESALRIAEEKLLEYKGAFKLANENFRNFDKVLRQFNLDSVDGMLFDLGVSSFQLEESERGFSFLKEGPLDMRMDKKNGEALWQVLNRLSEKELGDIIRDFGEERFWRRIAREIALHRKKSPIRDSLELANIIRRAVGCRYRDRIDPATRAFQAFRIFINDELGALKEALGKAGSFLREDARIVVISFHSLEDRIVKHSFRESAKNSILSILTKKPIRATEEEMAENPRSRSARLRAAQRL